MELNFYYLRFLLLILLAKHAFSVETLRDYIKSDSEDRELKDEKFYSQRIVNIHQPVYSPGYGNYHQINPLFITPPPPVVLTNSIIRPSPIYNSREVPIKNKINVMSYPNQFPNMFNYYNFQRPVAPYFGQDASINPYHPYNLAYGSAPFTPVPAFGLPFGPAGQLPRIMSQSESKNSRRMNILRRNLGFQTINPQENNQNVSIRPAETLQNNENNSPYTNIGQISPEGLGYNNLFGTEFDPFTAQHGPFGNMSPYNVQPARKLNEWI